jgi:hypothetical protein
METASPADQGVRSPEVENAIRRRAQDLYEHRGRLPGHEVEDWLQAESEVTREFASAPTPTPAFVVIRFEGVTYTGEYDTGNCNGYTPGEFRAGAPVQIRFEADKMYVKRPNGQHLETRIVKKQD